MAKRGKESVLSLLGLSSKRRKHKKKSLKRKALPSKGVNVRPALDALRDLKNWIFVFSQEYDLPDEAVSKLHEKIDDVAEKLR